MTTTAQKRAPHAYRSRLQERGLVRFEVSGLDTDRELIRTLVRKLAQEGVEATRIRTMVQDAIAEQPSRKGGILDALRRSPLVGAEQGIRQPIDAAATDAATPEDFAS